MGRKRARTARALMAVAAAAGITLATAAPGSAGTITRVYLRNASGVSTAHAGYNSANEHAWVCDDYNDGHPAYGVYYFPGGTSYRFYNHASSGECSGRTFDKPAYKYHVCLAYSYATDPCTDDKNT